MKSEKKCSFPLCDEKPWQDETDNMPAVPGENPDGLPTPDVDSDDVPATPGEGPDGFPMPELPPDSSDLPTDSIDPRLLSLAMAFVPRQAWETPYDFDVALRRGTLFASLDKPFLGEEAVSK